MNVEIVVIFVVVVLVVVLRSISIDGERIAAKARLYLMEKERDEYKEALFQAKAKYDEWEQQLITDHQRELDALRAKHLDEMAEKQAETEMYMESAKRLKEENDVLRAELAGYKAQP